jgi:tetratricopeptide (TPR) repeat protein
MVSLVRAGSLLVISTLTLPGLGIPARATYAGGYVPLALAVLSLVVGVRMLRGSWELALLTLAGGLGIAGWCYWLRYQLTGIQASSLAGALLPGVMLCGLITTVLVLLHGGSVFRLLVAGGFGYLALQALQNVSRFGLVAGVLIVWNLGEWFAQLQATPTERLAKRWATSLRLGMAAILGFWILALAMDRFHAWTGVPRRFALREQPFEFAREAIRFAGGPDLPDRALVYDLGQTGLYTFMNAPRHKAFMDGRLEMPDQETFETYITLENQLNQMDPRWIEGLHSLGNPLVLLSHEGNASAEAALLTHPNWRCIYFDVLAAVFVPADRTDLITNYPSVDFAARHFQRPPYLCVPSEPGAARRELRALYNLAVELRHLPETTRSLRIPIILSALDRANLALEEEPQPAAWILTGGCYWNMVPDLTARPPTPSDDWDPARALAWAQATYCFRQALKLAPDNAAALRYLEDIYRVRRMPDEPSPRGQAPDSLPWPLAEKMAVTFMHQGQPEVARQTWEKASDVPSEALRLCRYAESYWVERDFALATGAFQRSLELDPQLGEAAWGLAVLYCQLGDAQARPALARALQLPLTKPQETSLRLLDELLPDSGKRAKIAAAVP